jgi:hypothetical protein
VPLLGFPFAVAAITTGLLGLRDSRRNPRLGGRGRATLGVILGVINVVISGVAITALVLEKLSEKH